MVKKIYKIAFLGSDEIALPCLDFLQNECPLVEISAILTQPDRRVGRGRKLQSNPIKIWAETNHVLVRCPEKPAVNDCEWLDDQKIDLILVMAYGHILKNYFLELPKLGCFNLHASLLPKYRGASPIETAIAMGESKTGVTLMRVVEKMDAGPIVDSKSVEIDKMDTGATLRKKISLSCIPLLQRNIESLIRADIQENAQDGSLATYCRKLTKEDGNLDFSSSAEHLNDRIRAFQAWPGCSFLFAEQKIRLGGALSCKNDFNLEVGETFLSEKGDFLLGTSDGVLAPTSLQRPGGKMLETSEFLRGFNFPFGSTLRSFPMKPLIT